MDKQMSLSDLSDELAQVRTKKTEFLAQIDSIIPWGEWITVLTRRNLILKKGTIVDSTFIEAPSSTKNKEQKRDPEAHSAKNGSTWHFGCKDHVGVDHETGIVHSLEVTSANEHDVCVTAELLTGEEEVVYGDSGYLGAEKQSDAATRNKSEIRQVYSLRSAVRSKKAPQESKE